MNEETPSKDAVLFARLLFLFHSSAMQQLGKIADPISGRIERNLEEARLSIDTLDMLRTKCKGNLTPEEERFLNHIVSELKLNYVDELKRPPTAEPPPPEPPKKEAEAPQKPAE